MSVFGGGKQSLMETSGSVSSDPGTEWLHLLPLIAFSQLFGLCHFFSQTGMKKNKFGSSGLEQLLCLEVIFLS